MLSGVALLANGFFVLSRPLSTRQVTADGNQISPLSSDPGWTESLRKLFTVPDTSNGIQIANADLDTLPTSPALSMVQTNGIGDIARLPGSSSNSYSFSPLPQFKSEQVATIQGSGNFPIINSVTDMPSITQSSYEMADASAVMDDSGQEFPEFDKADTRYCFYTWFSESQSVVLSDYIVNDAAIIGDVAENSFAGTHGCGHSQSWDQFSKDFVHVKPGYVIFKDGKNNYFSMTNLVKSQCKKLNGKWNCDDSTSKSITLANKQWMDIVQRKFGAEVPSLGPIHSATELQQYKPVFSFGNLID